MTIKDINNNQLIYTVKELINDGYTHYKINKLVDEGKLKKLNKCHYENNDFSGDFNDFYYVNAYIEDGVICLMSAASYYGLTTFRCESIDVAIERKKKVSTLPSWPNIKVHYYTDERHTIGINIITDNNNVFKIYDIEKTVIDIIYYREKIGIEETKEILLNYLRRKDKDLNKLIRYSKKLKCSDVLNKYLEVLV